LQACPDGPQPACLASTTLAALAAGFLLPTALLRFLEGWSRSAFASLLHSAAAHA
jgi:hypothetical protein